VDGIGIVGDNYEKRMVSIIALVYNVEAVIEEFIAR
jgi:hypothetical protein